jgi:hypothetical protein
MINGDKLDPYASARVGGVCDRTRKETRSYV